MQRKRIFIAINLPEGVKNELAKFAKRWLDLPARWTKKDNLHITLAFIGYVTDEQIPEICKVALDIASRHSPFEVRLTKVIYGPPKKMPPRMVWAKGENSEPFAGLRDDLEKSLAGSDGIRFTPENRVFSPHITLARLRTWEWRKLELEERPQVNEDIDLAFEVKSIEVMESRLKRGGAEYIILETCNLKPEI